MDNLASSLCLEPYEDDSPGTLGVDREIDYKVVYADSKENYHGGEKNFKDPALYVNEVLDKPLNKAVEIAPGEYSTASPKGETNQWNDLLSNAMLGGKSGNVLQSFTVSGGQGLYPAIKSAINVCYGGDTYGTLGLYFNSQSHTVLVNGLTKLPGTQGTSQ